MQHVNASNCQKKKQASVVKLQCKIRGALGICLICKPVGWLSYFLVPPMGFGPFISYIVRLLHEVTDSGRVDM
jgi:hypothetical protein